MYLGIDLGTSSVKVCVIGDAGRVVATTTAPLETQRPFAEASEQDCDAWWRATVAAVTSVPDDLRARVRAVGLSGQMHGAVLLDEAGTAIRPAILWNDGRAVEECGQILAAEPDAGHLSGAVPMPGFTAPKLLWLSRHQPDAHARIAHVLLPKDYIGFRLHGGYVTDPSDAAGTGWLDQQTRTWSRRLCEVSATDPAWLPDIRHGSDVAGHLLADPAATLGLKAGLPVAAGAGDAASGAIGIGAVRDGDAFISLGTSGQLFVTTSSYRPNPESRIHAYAHTVPGHWFQMAAMLNGARPMAWFAELMQQPIEALLKAAETAPKGPIFLPYLTGERTPHGDTTIRGAFTGLGETATPGTLMRAVVEAIAFTFADARRAFAEAGTDLDRVLAIGGGTRSDFLMQMIADVTGWEIGRSDGADVGPALGAARLALNCDQGGGAEVFAKVEAERWFRPTDANDAETKARLKRFRALYHALKDLDAEPGQ